MKFRWSWIGCFLILGLAFRTCHYLRAPSVWHDEAALVLNVIGKNFTELLGPLFFAEASPPLFLWMERAVFLLLGDSASALRLLPYLASCATLFSVAWTARRVLAPAAATWAVLLFAASDRVLWHGCEAKPYATDMLVAALLMALIAANQTMPLARRLLLFAALAPALIFLSYPACFILGSVLVVLLLPVAEQRQIGPWLAYGLLAAVILTSFGLLVIGPVHAQRATAMDNCWVHQFPPWETPWRIPAWAFFSTLDVLRYCFEPAGHALALLAVIGAIVLWRQQQRGLVVLALLPLALALAAAFLGAYPYGGARVEAFAAPGLALVVAASVPPLWTWLQARVRFGGLALAALLLAGPALAAYHAALPWRRPDSAAAAAFVLDHRLPDEPVAANVWQADYYFRHLGRAYQTLDGKTIPPANHVWLVMTAWPDSLRNELIANTVGRGRVIGRREFTDTTVVLMERASSSAD